MLSENPIRSALSLLLVAVLLSTVFFAPTVAQATTYPEREVKLLLVYDDTYEYAMRSNGITGSLEHRLEQMARLAEVPFKQTWNISFDVTVMSYENAFGTEPYVNSCPNIHGWEELQGKEGTYFHEYWRIGNQCQCVADNQCYTSLSNPGHHNSAYRLVYTANNFALASSNYDAVGIYAGHKLCYYKSSEQLHTYCGGMAIPNGYGFIGIGYGDMVDSETLKYSNLISNRELLWHEFSHNYGLQNGTVDFTDPNNCNENYPCTMSGGFSGVVYAGTVWCPNCRSHFNYSKMGTLIGGE